MRKRLMIMLCIILVLTAIPGMQSALASDEDSNIVRVKLSVGTSTTVSFFADGNYTVPGSDTAIERQQYTVKLENGSLNLYCGSTRIYGGSSIMLTRHAPTSGRNNFIWMYNAHYDSSLKYSGDMEFIVDTETACIQVVNHIYIEDYLYGVVPYEMNDSWPPEALKAQAITARNYAAKNMGSAGSYDLTDDSSNDQVYKGYSSSTPNAINAVDDTVGQVLTYGANIIDCYYSASNGGWTDIPYHRWGGGSDWPYYVIVADPYDIANTSSRYETISLPVVIDEVHSLTTSQTQGLLGTINVTNAVNLIKDEILKSKQLDSYGVDSADDFTLTGVMDLYTHTYDTDNKQDHNLTQDLDHDGISDANLCMDKVRAMGAFTVSVGETALTVTNIDFDLRRLKSNGDYPAFFAADLGVFIVETVKDEGGTPIAFTLSMKRFGHGVGLSQRGAQQRASSSDPSVNTFDKILEFYYPGAALTVQGYSAPVLTAVPTSDHTNAVLIADNVSVRSVPTTSGNTPLNKLPIGARIEVVQANAATTPGITWHKILYGGQYAYIAANYNAAIYVSLDNPQPTRELCSVSFNTNGGNTISAQTINHGDSIAASPSVLKTGYTFAEWCSDSSLNLPVSFPYIVTGNSTLYVKWTPVSYTLTYNLGGGSASNPGSYTIESASITLSNPTRTGYTFTGWTGTGLSEATMNVTIPAGSAGERSYTANWQVDTYTINYILNGGSASNPGSYTIESASFTLANPTKPGFIFAGWSGTDISGSAMTVAIPQSSTGNRSYTANWSADTYIISYNLDDGSATNPGSYTIESASFTLENPTKPGYAFTGWSGTDISGNVMTVTIPHGSTGNRSYTAHWIRLICTVTFDAQGGSDVDSMQKNGGESIAASPVTTRSHYTFGGWCTTSACNTAPTAFPYTVTDNVKFFAKWTPESYALSYNIGGGSASNPSSYTIESASITLSNPRKTGYTFTGWTGTGLSESTMNVTIPVGSTGARYYTANWRADTYTINYNLNNGSATNPGSYTIESASFTLVNPTKSGYSFMGWTGTGLSEASTNVTIPTGTAGNRSYTANWVLICTVTFDAQGGSGVAGVQRNQGESIASSPVTTRQSYNFGGWYPTSACNTAAVSFPYTATGNVTLYAKWSPQPQTAYLSGISLSTGSMNKGFSRTTYSYKVILSENEGSVTFTPFRENDTASMTISGKAVGSYTVSLANGKSTTVSVKVKFGKTTKTYKFAVSRAKSTNNNLATLTASAGAFDRAFVPNVTSYTLTLNEFTKSVKLYDTVASPLASASFKSKTVSLSNGQTKKVTLTVKSQSGSRKTYTIIVTRMPSTDTSLKYLKTNSSRYPLTPVFSPGVTSYTVTLPANRSYVTISAKVLGYKAVVYFDGSKRSSKKVTLASGHSVTVHVTVVAQAGNTKDYYITVMRP